MQHQNLLVNDLKVLTWYLFKILLTQPCDTLNCLEITQGRTPAAAISTIFSLIWLGNGLPLINTPPNWLTRPWPEKEKLNIESKEKYIIDCILHLKICKWWIIHNPKSYVINTKKFGNLFIESWNSSQRKCIIASA